MTLTLPGRRRRPTRSRRCSATGTAGRGQADDQLLVPTFIVGDPWRTLITGSVPFWAFFSVQSALAALEDHLARSDPYAVVRLLLFQHGADSPGIARPEDWTATIEKYGARADFLGLDTDKFPHDIGFLGRYGPRLATPAPRPPPLVTLGREHGPDWPGRRRSQDGGRSLRTLRSGPGATRRRVKRRSRRA